MYIYKRRHCGKHLKLQSSYYLNAELARHGILVKTLTLFICLSIRFNLKESLEYSILLNDKQMKKNPSQVKAFQIKRENREYKAI